ncbi:MAG: phosphopentomutase [Butyrivibrio sp.]|nr:phosphopentomutase [Butyrivibrio sp.]
MARVIWIVLDGVGMGALPDAEKFGDAGANTLAHTWEYKGGLSIPNLLSLGLGNIDGMKSLPAADKPVGAYARAGELSEGKDTTVGHWEMAGVISERAFPTYPNGFPRDIIEEFTKRTGVSGVLGNCVASGTEIIKELGAEHERTGMPIVYTSADSVFQIAVNVERYPLERLYEMCRTARGILCGSHEVARVIARPFVGHDGAYKRTADRRDYAVLPPKRNLLNRLKEQGFDVIAVGKIEDIFAGSGITEAVHTKSNMHGVDVTLSLMKKETNGIIFTNLVEFDSSWGHRRDAAGYAGGLEEFDARLPELMGAMKSGDLLIINADHGCDPTFKGTDHTREYVPILVYGQKIAPQNFGTRRSFADIGQSVAEYLGAEPIENGESFMGLIGRAGL